MTTPVGLRMFMCTKTHEYCSHAGFNPQRVSNRVEDKTRSQLACCNVSETLQIRDCSGLSISAASQFVNCATYMHVVSR